MLDYSDLLDALFTGLKQRGWMLVTAESCTGGMIAAAITDRAGSSSILERGFVTYSNQAKMDCLDVSPETLKQFGAVSAQCAGEMAEGALKHSNADIAISVTGIAGPDGGSNDKPVGLVYIGCCIKGGEATVQECHFDGNRDAVRQQTTLQALQKILDQAGP